MKKAFLIAILAALVTQPVKAEIVKGMYPLEVRTATETFRGYLILKWKEEFDASKPAALEYIKSQNYPLALYESIERTAPMADGAQVSISTKKPVRIRPQNIVSIEPLKWPRSGEQIGDIAIVTPADAALLITKAKAACRSKIWDCDYWISYSTNVVQDDLDDLCDRDFQSRPSDAEQKALLDKPGVVHFSYFCD